jgi:hypothetical protein
MLIQVDFYLIAISATTLLDKNNNFAKSKFYPHMDEIRSNPNLKGSLLIYWDTVFNQIMLMSPEVKQVKSNAEEAVDRILRVLNHSG